MYCCNCGNKLEDGAVVCIKCGVFVDNQNIPISKTVKKRKENNYLTGIVSIIIGIISFYLTIKVMIGGMGNVSTMSIENKVGYAINLTINPFIWALISFLIAIGSRNRNKILNIIGLSLSLLSIFFLLTEIVMVFIV